MREAQQRKRQRIQWSVGVVVLVVAAVVVLVLVKSSKSGDSDSASLVPEPAPASIATDVAEVPLSAIAAAHAAGTSTNPPRPIADGKLRKAEGKPDVLYMGGLFCPYCAGERWALAVALSKFGTFSDLDIVHSAESDVPTLSFTGSTFQSDYVTFTPKEIRGNEKQGNGWNELETATDEQMALLADPGGGSFPFIDFGGKMYQSGGSVDVSLLIGEKQTEIAEKLAASTDSDTSQGSLPGNVNQVAGEFIQIICGLTDGQPGDVCKAFPAG